MAGSAGDRTEEATPKRREESRKRGQVARSQEVNTLMSLLAAFTMLSFVGSWLLAGPDRGDDHVPGERRDHRADQRPPPAGA